MDKRAGIPPKLPYPNPTISYWQDPPSSLSNHQTTSELPATVDVVIIGSGITGACIAANLLDHDSPPSVLMLEARTACSGATGRNGGHTKHASYRHFIDNCKTEGEAEAAKIARFEYNCMKGVHSFAREYDIECDSWEGDTVDIIYDEGQLIKARKAVAKMKRILGEDDPVAKYHLWDPDETRRRYHVEGSLGSVSYAAGSLSAYRFVIGVLKSALGRGLNLQTQTPALRIIRSSKGDSRWTVETHRGAVSASKLVLATNGYTAHLSPPFQGVIVPLRGHMTAQRPGQSLPQDGLPTTYSFIYDDGYEYMIPRPQGSRFAGDIMIGGGLTKAIKAGLQEFGTTDDATADPIIQDYLIDCTESYFGSNWGKDHPEGRLRQAWTGIMGYSSDGFPFVGRMPGEDGLYVAASFQGSGMVLSLLCAKALTHMMTKHEQKSLDAWFPKAFRLGPERLNSKFRGRLHSTAPMDLELKSQI